MPGAGPQTGSGGLKSQEIFISYRRTSDLMAEHLHEKLSAHFGAQRIFLDRIDIDPGAGFPDSIKDAVTNAVVVLVVIGRGWISAQDERTYRRHLDIPDDWVRKEIEFAMAGEGTVIPVLVDDAPMPTAEQLPESLARLASYEPVRLSRDHGSDDFANLVRAIMKCLVGAESGLGEGGSAYPQGSAGHNGYKPSPLSERQIAEMLKWLPQWRVVESELSDDPRFGGGYKRIDIRRDFRFDSFLAAIAFMRQAAEQIEAINHHPRWENLFRTVTVNYSTWDVGHRLSDRDLQSAEMMERAYHQFVSQE